MAIVNKQAGGIFIDSKSKKKKRASAKWKTSGKSNADDTLNPFGWYKLALGRLVNFSCIPFCKVMVPADSRI